MMLQPGISHTAQHSQACTRRSRLWSPLHVSSVSDPRSSILSCANLRKDSLDLLLWLIVIAKLHVLSSDATLDNVEHELYGIHVWAVWGQKSYEDASRLAQPCHQVMACVVYLGIVEDEYAVGKGKWVHDRQEVVQQEVEQGLEIPRVLVDFEGSGAIRTERREYIVTNTVQIPASRFHPLSAATSQWMYFSRRQQNRAGEQQRLCVCVERERGGKWRYMGPRPLFLCISPVFVVISSPKTHWSGLNPISRCSIQYLSRAFSDLLWKTLTSTLRERSILYSSL